MVSATGTAKVLTLARADPVFARLRGEAEEAVRKEPDIAGFMFSAILNHDSLEAAIIHRLAARLGHSVFPSDLIEHAYLEAIAADPSISEAFRADIAAVVDRDPACTRLIEPVLYFKGFHAIETHRLAHALWNAGRQDFALYLQSRSSEVFQTDIHPAARIGKGIFLDHATGLVVGATAAIGDNVSMLQDVTLGGTGKERGDRHPKIKQRGPDRRGRQNPRQHRDWPLFPGRRRFGRAAHGARQQNGGGRAGADCGGRRLRRTLAQHGSNPCSGACRRIISSGAARLPPGRFSGRGLVR